MFNLDYPWKKIFPRCKVKNVVLGKFLRKKLQFEVGNLDSDLMSHKYFVSSLGLSPSLFVGVRDCKILSFSSGCYLLSSMSSCNLAFIDLTEGWDDRHGGFISYFSDEELHYVKSDFGQLTILKKNTEFYIKYVNSNAKGKLKSYLCFEFDNLSKKVFESN